jgi:hypothetical protein
MGSADGDRDVFPGFTGVSPRVVLCSCSTERFSTVNNGRTRVGAAASSVTGGVGGSRGVKCGLGGGQGGIDRCTVVGDTSVFVRGGVCRWPSAPRRCRCQDEGCVR